MAQEFLASHRIWQPARRERYRPARGIRPWTLSLRIKPYTPPPSIFHYQVSAERMFLSPRLTHHVHHTMPWNHIPLKGSRYFPSASQRFGWNRQVRCLPCNFPFRRPFSRNTLLRYGNPPPISHWAWLPRRRFRRDFEFRCNRDKSPSRSPILRNDTHGF